MPRVAGINHQRAVRALEKAGFRVLRESGHVVMVRGQTTIYVPRHNPIKPYTMGGIVLDAGLTVEEFRALL